MHKEPRWKIVEVSYEYAKNKFNEILSEHKGFCMEDVVKLDAEWVYVLYSISPEGKLIWPGEKFKSIRITDGELIDYSLPTPG